MNVRRGARVPTRNWSGEVRFDPARAVAPADEQQVLAVLADARRTGRTVRVIGAGHSFTPLARTDGILLSLDHLQGVVAADVETGLVTLRGGTRLWRIAELLAPHGLALESMGDIDRQSIAGATQTGTHGTGHAFTGLAGTVRALKLALADGSIVSCSADRNPELFHAARLSLGTLGVVLEVTIQAVPRYALAMTETTAPIEETASAFLHTSTEADHQEFFHFLGTDRATVRTTSRVPADTPVTRRSAPVELLHRELLGNGAFELMCRAAVLIPPLSGPVAEVASRAFAGPPVTDDSARVYVAPRRVRFHESEWALPAEHFEEAFAALRRRIREERIRVTFPVEVRRVAADDVWLSTAYGRDTVYIAAHRYHRERPDPYLLLVQRTLEPFAARPHWGKKHWLDAPALRDLYPRFEDHAAVRRTADPGGLFMTPYLRHILGP